MRNFTTTILIMFALIGLNISTRTAQWVGAHGAGNTTGNDVSQSVATDPSGNVFVTGAFISPTITFGTTTLTNAGTGTPDVFIVKYSSAGIVQWAKSANGSGFDLGLGIATDASGNAYVTGSFSSDTLRFGTISIINDTAQSTDIFVAKYDPSGNVLWAKHFGGSDNDEALSIATSGTNVYITGGFASAHIAFGTTTLTNNGPTVYKDVFIAKLDGSGNALWAKSAGGIYSDEGYGIAADAAGNAYITGLFGNHSPIIFGTDTLLNSGGSDIFTVKYNSSGTVVWAKSAGGTGNEVPGGIAIDAGGNVYITGAFSSSMMFFAYFTLSNLGNGDIYVAKYTAAGFPEWGRVEGEQFGFDEGFAIAPEART